MKTQRPSHNVPRDKQKKTFTHFETRKKGLKCKKQKFGALVSGSEIKNKLIFRNSDIFEVEILFWMAKKMEIFSDHKDFLRYTPYPKCDGKQNFRLIHKKKKKLIKFQQVE